MVDGVEVSMISGNEQCVSASPTPSSLALIGLFFGGVGSATLILATVIIAIIL